MGPEDICPSSKGGLSQAVFVPSPTCIRHSCLDGPVCVPAVAHPSSFFSTSGILHDLWQSAQPLGRSALETQGTWLSSQVHCPEGKCRETSSTFPQRVWAFTGHGVDYPDNAYFMGCPQPPQQPGIPSHINHLLSPLRLCSQGIPPVACPCPRASPTCSLVMGDPDPHTHMHTPHMPHVCHTPVPHAHTPCTHRGTRAHTLTP